MKITIKKQAFVPPPPKQKGLCPDCSKWTQDKTPPDKIKRGLGNCLYHGVFTPTDGTCNAFQRKKHDDISGRAEPARTEAVVDRKRGR